ncbi:UNVERIFIED_CONTAM: hypothetical protein FKN15_027141 [Acipenser sinensis]
MWVRLGECVMVKSASRAVCYQICCSGVLYSSKPGYRCCEDKYIPVNGNSTAVCCGGQLYTPQPNYECCGGYYVKVAPGYMCCPNSDQIRVSVGVGNSCCSGNPYSRSGDQICCAGTLHDGFHKQCCGGQVVSKDLICCGNEEKGSVHKEFQDTDLDPHVTYEYRVAAWNSYSQGFSDFSSATTEQDVPQGVGPPRWRKVDNREDIVQLNWKPPAQPNVTALGPTDLQLSWRVPAKPNGIIKEYQIIQTGRGLIYTDGAGRMQCTVTGLQPHTNYSFMVKACTSAGCSASQPSIGRTLQAAPQGVWSSPRHVVVSSDVVELYWNEPSTPNGIISQYRLIRDGMAISTGDSGNLNYTDTGLQPNTRRPVGTQDELLVFIWSEGALEFIDASDILQPHTEYEYRVRARNTRGSVDSLWSSTQTLEALPQGMAAPSVQPTSAYSVLLNWTEPASPNGIIAQYRVVYQKRSSDPTFNTSAVTAVTVPKPYPSGRLTAAEEAFSITQANTGSGHLKGRWRILLKRTEVQH